MSSENVTSFLSVRSSLSTMKCIAPIIAVALLAHDYYTSLATPCPAARHAKQKLTANSGWGCKVGMVPFHRSGTHKQHYQHWQRY